MARKLKTYQTSLGFFDQAIAAPSMKAALEAWGADSLSRPLPCVARFRAAFALAVARSRRCQHRLSFEIDGRCFPGRGLIVGSKGAENDIAAVNCCADDFIGRIKFSEPDPKLGTNRVVVVPA
jgi:hypothetical protein